MAASVPTIVPARRQETPSRANASQGARCGKSLKWLDLPGKTKIAERQATVFQTASCYRFGGKPCLCCDESPPSLGTLARDIDKPGRADGARCASLRFRRCVATRVLPSAVSTYSRRHLRSPAAGERDFRRRRAIRYIDDRLWRVANLNGGDHPIRQRIDDGMARGKVGLTYHTSTNHQ